MACPWSGAKCGCGDTFVRDPHDVHKQLPWQVDQYGKMPERCASFLTPALRDLHKRELPPTPIVSEKH